ncbi:MAG: 4-alpha-glucanotransferase [Defluviitaleaceae bacterium]|nr:4-alpha-glucanotransferase [Defluviitaleaceae bacterium]
MDFPRTSGILAHITSLYTKFGIGDLGQAAYNFIDFLKEGKQTLWQILPVGPTSFGDSPYQSFSTFAGNHLLICPEKLVDWGLLTQNDIIFEYNFPDNIVDYYVISEFKNHMFRLAFANFATGIDQNMAKKYSVFVEQNAFWLADYSLFVALKAHFINQRRHETESSDYLYFARKNSKVLSKNQIDDFFYGAVWQSWPRDIAQGKVEAIIHWREQLADEIEYHNFLQFIFFKQFAELKRYATKNDVKIVGDIPIFVAYDSADCWSHQDLFMMDSHGTPNMVAGVPPDYFATDGQLWGNPLYNWENHKKDGYTWWLSRISKALECCDILRIDHFRGFESFWAVPYSAKTAKDGKWMPGPGREFFDIIKKRLGDLPIIAEDLGIITPAVEQLRDDLALPGMKVLHFGFGTQAPNAPHNFATSNMVVYTGTHDNDTTLGWYNAADDETKDLLRRYLNVDGSDVPWDLIRAAFLSTANMAIIPVQDVLGLDTQYRMNTPGTASGNWRFRLAAGQLQSRHAEGLCYLSELSDRNI